MTVEWWEYLAVFAASGTLCAVFTPHVVRFAVSRNLLDQPGGHKSHDTAVPYLGGVAIVVAFAVSLVIVALFKSSHNATGELAIVMGLAVFLSMVGLIDDLRHVSVLWRVIAEVVSGVVLWLLGSGVTVTGIQVLDLGLTVLWIVGITNAFNLLDNMDGLAAGLAAISSLTIFAVAVSSGQFLVAALAMGLAGCTVGFLRHNFHPARVYMGDGGSLFIGFVVGYLCIKLRIDSGGSVNVLIPVLACSAPIFDTSLVTVSRLVAGLSPFQGGRDHVSHRIVRLGLTVPVAVTTIYLAATGIGILVFVISTTDPTSAWLLIGTIGVTLAIVGGFLLTVPVYSDGPDGRLSN